MMVQHPFRWMVRAVITVLYDDDWIGSISKGGIGMSSVDGMDTEYIPWK